MQHWPQCTTSLLVSPGWGWGWQCRQSGTAGKAESLMFRRWGRLLYCFQEIEPFVLEPGKLLLTKLMESDRKMEVLLTKMELNGTPEGFSIEVRQLLPLSALPLLIPVVHSLLCSAAKHLAAVFWCQCICFHFFIEIESKSFLQDLEELWATIQQESLTRKEWIREWDETLKKVEQSRADKVSSDFQELQAPERNQSNSNKTGWFLVIFMNWYLII